jgi:hypothetical protein
MIEIIKKIWASLKEINDTHAKFYEEHGNYWE